MQQYCDSKEVFKLLKQINWHINRVDENKITKEVFKKLQGIEGQLDLIIPYFGGKDE